MRLLFMVPLCFALIFVSACGGTTGSGNSAAPSGTTKSGDAAPSASTPAASKAPANDFNPNEKVALKMGLIGAGLTDEEFQNLIVAPIQKVYPNVSIELVRMNPAKVEELLTAKDYPDFTFMNSGAMLRDVEYSLPVDILPWVKKNNIDLSQFDSAFTDLIDYYSGKGKMFLLPLWSASISANFYNKDIFDKFGVGYPKDNMTWDETFELARKVARVDSGTQYIGIAVGGVHNMESGLGTPLADPVTHKGLLESDNWKLVFQTYDKLQKIPGNYNHGQGMPKMFETDKVLAMMASYVGRIGEFEKLYQAGTPMNFDIATFPSYGNSKYASVTDVSGLSFYVNSSKQDWAFRAAMVLLKKENQLEAAQNGRASVLKDKELQKQFGAKLGSMKGKHIEGFFTKPTAMPGFPTKYDDLGNKRLNDAIKKVLDGSADINSALREANELLNQDIAANP
ncbi:MAG: family 1 extracellular solute-binding protein [Paenibacillaceae bacterium]|jgi:multiple sugar transport system substrate-binding protein|nr:family 1 extracellular solute-binding protein [Paenibacillaceae bacterium]